MRMDAERHAEEDRKLREPIEAREKAESLVDDAHRQLMQLSEKMSAADKGLVEDLVQHLQEVKEKLNSDRTNSLINRSSSNLVPVVTPVFALAQAITTSDSDEEFDFIFSDDGSIDAEFDCVD